MYKGRLVTSVSAWVWSGLRGAKASIEFGLGNTNFRCMWIVHGFLAQVHVDSAFICLSQRSIVQCAYPLRCRQPITCEREREREREREGERERERAKV